MSQAGFYLSHRARWGYQYLLGVPEHLTDIMLYDGLTDPMTGGSMGAQTERLPAKHHIGQDELDEIAFMSTPSGGSDPERMV